jgi:hypothetical protein
MILLFIDIVPIAGWPRGSGQFLKSGFVGGMGLICVNIAGILTVISAERKILGYN